MLPGVCLGIWMQVRPPSGLFFEGTTTATVEGMRAANRCRSSSLNPGNRGWGVLPQTYPASASCTATFRPGAVFFQVPETTDVAGMEMCEDDRPDLIRFMAQIILDIGKDCFPASRNTRIDDDKAVADK